MPWPSEWYAHVVVRIIWSVFVSSRYRGTLLPAQTVRHCGSAPTTSSLLISSICTLFGGSPDVTRMQVERSSLWGCSCADSGARANRHPCADLTCHHPGQTLPFSQRPQLVRLPLDCGRNVAIECMTAPGQEGTSQRKERVGVRSTVRSLRGRRPVRRARRR